MLSRRERERSFSVGEPMNPSIANCTKSSQALCSIRADQETSDDFIVILQDSMALNRLEIYIFPNGSCDRAGETV